METTYKVIKTIGEGSFGKCFLVKYPEDSDETFILKKIKIDTMSKKDRKEALNEVCVLKQLDHPHIIKYNTSFVESGNLCIVMEYAPGGDLCQYLKKRKGVHVAEETVLAQFVQLCQAINYIHSHRILHRDLKTQNVFLTNDGKVKLGDFGISKILNETKGYANTLVGTPYYLSPELCQEKPYNNKSDIWSLGCCLYEMCMFKHPFEGNTMKQLVAKILKGAYNPVSCRYSSEMRSLIHMMLNREPKKRPSISKILELPFLQQYILGTDASPFSYKVKLGINPNPLGAGEIDDDTDFPHHHHHHQPQRASVDSVACHNPEPLLAPKPHLVGAAPSVNQNQPKQVNVNLMDILAKKREKILLLKQKMEEESANANIKKPAFGVAKDKENVPANQIQQQQQKQNNILLKITEKKELDPEERLRRLAILEEARKKKKMQIAGLHEQNLNQQENIQAPKILVQNPQNPDKLQWKKKIVEFRRNRLEKQISGFSVPEDKENVKPIL